MMRMMNKVVSRVATSVRSVVDGGKNGTVTQPRRPALPAAGVAEARKLSSDGNYNCATLDTLSGLITDSLPAENIRQAAADYGVEIIVP